MIPIRDNTRPRTFPFINYLLIAINVGVFMLMTTMSGQALEQFVFTYALQPSEVTQGQDFVTLVTSMFLHGGLGHLVGNMLFLHIFGDNLEDYLGKIRYLLFYLASGLAAAGLQIFIDPSSSIPMLGASGAIAGLMGGYLVLFPNHRIDILVPSFLGFFRGTVPAYSMLVYWFIFQLISGFGSLSLAGGGGVAFFAHIGGFVAGAIMALLSR